MNQESSTVDAGLCKQTVTTEAGDCCAHNISPPVNCDQASAVPTGKVLQHQNSEDECLEFSDSNDYDELEICRRVRHKSSRECIYDDSGFNSSDNEEKDDISELSFCSCDSHSSETSDIHDLNSDIVVRKTVVDSSVANTNNRRTSISLLKNISERRISRRMDRLISTTSNNSSESENSPAGSSRITPRSARHHGTIDKNNNYSRSNSIQSNLWSPPFKLNHCFQDKGFLCFVACIVYAMFLVFAVGCLGLLGDVLKSSISKDDIRKIKSNVRHERRAVTAG
ncbi:uncharacterized protein LOC131940079 [Physella acuta]|uniref:uncharacterized protein LOC131940079 n=1 Tax=Physella acuta TaxID=109671 RepID=UPI0027DD8DBC|nr:uncharacterized protein LOC131940079 [Physella acuta]XP_059154630.1 uncharacterized protein LOC131940079 [Physella acuta]